MLGKSCNSQFLFGKSLDDGDDLGQGTHGIIKGLARLQEFPQLDQNKLQILTMICHEE
jgi:hypothetical protein